MQIDWAATGSMLSGWATLAGALAVIYAARTGANTFAAWKRQKVEERRMDAAERIMTLAYRMRPAFATARSRGILGGETKAAQDTLDANWPDWRQKGIEEQRRITTAQTVLNRLHAYREDWEQIWVLKPIALAHFGKDIEDALHSFWTAYVEVEVSASEMAEDTGHDRAFTVELRRAVFGQDGDQVNETIERAVSLLERELLPVIRMHQHPA